MDAFAWSAQQLAEFIAAVSAAEKETDAARAAVERVAEALDADVAAIVCGGELVAGVGCAGRGWAGASARRDASCRATACADARGNRPAARDGARSVDDDADAPRPR